VVVLSDQPPLAELRGAAGLVSVGTEGFTKPPERRARREPALVAEDQEGKKPVPMAATAAPQSNM
jgi:hypothetical protein